MIDYYRTLEQVSKSLKDIKINSEIIRNSLIMYKHQIRNLPQVFDNEIMSKIKGEESFSLEFTITGISIIIISSFVIGILYLLFVKMYSIFKSKRIYYLAVIFYNICLIVGLLLILILTYILWISKRLQYSLEFTNIVTSEQYLKSNLSHEMFLVVNNTLNGKGFYDYEEKNTLIVNKLIDNYMQTYLDFQVMKKKYQPFNNIDLQTQLQNFCNDPTIDNDTSSNSPANLLKGLNKLTDSSENGDDFACKDKIFDMLIFNGKCKDNYIEINIGMDYSSGIGTKCCLKIEKNDISKRYKTDNLNCKFELEKFKNYYNALYEYKQEVNSFNLDLNSIFNILQSDIKGYNSHISNSFDYISKYYNSDELNLLNILDSNDSSIILFDFVSLIVSLQLLGKVFYTYYISLSIFVIIYITFINIGLLRLIRKKTKFELDEIEASFTKEINMLEKRPSMVSYYSINTEQ